jgi:hypothetical protein
MDLIRNSGSDPVADRLFVHLQLRGDLGDGEELFGLGHRTKPRGPRPAGSRPLRPGNTSRSLQRTPDPHSAASKEGAAQAGGHPDRQSLPGGCRLLPALGVQVRAAQGAAGRVWGDALDALGAVARMHRTKDAAHGCEDAKQSVRSV